MAKNRQEKLLHGGDLIMLCFPTPICDYCSLLWRRYLLVSLNH